MAESPPLHRDNLSSVCVQGGVAPRCCAHICALLHLVPSCADCSSAHQPLPSTVFWSMRRSQGICRHPGASLRQSCDWQFHFAAAPALQAHSAWDPQQSGYLLEGVPQQGVQAHLQQCTDMPCTVSVQLRQALQADQARRRLRANGLNPNEMYESLVGPYGWSPRLEKAKLKLERNMFWQTADGPELRKSKQELEHMFQKEMQDPTDRESKQDSQSSSDDPQPPSGQAAA